jgi:ribose-phosphate pyrophosphokinase
VTATVFGVGHAALAERLAARLDAERGALELRRFPDGEHYLRVLGASPGRHAIVVADLADPDQRLTQTLLLAATLRDLGAARITLIAPYLPYMRQDARFQPGEGVTSRYFARWIDAHFDALLTIEPHLHRYASLAELYARPALALSAAPLLAAWIAANVSDGFLIGPDAESRRWTEAVAAHAGLPCAVLAKVRRGDREVAVEVPALPALAGRTPVLVDDMISTGHTLADAARKLIAQGHRPPVVAAVHGLFAEGAEALLRESGIVRVVTCGTVPHPSNGCAVDGLLVEGLAALERG